MSRETSVDDRQLTLDLDGDAHDAVLRAREHRRLARMPESVTDAEVVGRLHAILCSRKVRDADGLSAPESAA